MHEFNIAPELRFIATIGGREFTHETGCTSLREAQEVCEEMHREGNIRLAAARIDIETGLPDGGCANLDEEGQQLFKSLCDMLELGLETYWNERLGSYDKFNNRVTPADMGNHFPDGTIRVVWKEDETWLGLDDAIRIVKAGFELLVEMQKRSHFLPTEEELDDGNYESVVARRRDFLFQAGVWPDADNEFDEEAFETREALLEAYPVATEAENA